MPYTPQNADEAARILDVCKGLSQRIEQLATSQAELGEEIAELRQILFTIGPTPVFAIVDNRTRRLVGTKRWTDRALAKKFLEEDGTVNTRRYQVVEVLSEHPACYRQKGAIFGEGFIIL